VGEYEMQNITNAVDYSFDAEVLKCDVPVLTKFWAEWSTPSKKLDPYIEEIASTYGEHVKVVNLDIDANPVTSSKYSVLKLPTVILFRNGIPVERLEGAVSKNELVNKIKPHIQVA
jgi:thioredoxin 1